jgi:hypothetical protein
MADIVKHPVKAARDHRELEEEAANTYLIRALPHGRYAVSGASRHDKVAVVETSAEHMLGDILQLLDGGGGVLP